MTTNQVILVDTNDIPIGTMGKMEVHRKGLLHRAVSVFIINSGGEWLLQRRALNKYHSNGLWTNTCCTHPYRNESCMEAANRRLMEEMGMRSPLTHLFSFTYRETINSELTEHELDHVFMGITDDIPKMNPDEVCEWKFMGYDALLNDIMQNPDHYTVWFKKIYQRVHQSLTKTEKNI